MFEVIGWVFFYVIEFCGDVLLGVLMNVGLIIYFLFIVMNVGFIEYFECWDIYKEGI